MDNSFDEKQWLNDLGPETRMKFTELREQIQEDILSFFNCINNVSSDFYKMCQIVVDNFKKY